MKSFFLWLICLLASSVLHSQNTLSGLVINAVNNEGIPFVNIYFPELEKGTISDEEGIFSISNLPTGTYKIIFSYIGFETYSISVTLPTEQQFIAALNISAIEIEEVILSTPFHKLQSENVMKVEQKKVADLLSSGATNLSQGITNIAGVESISTGLSIGKPVIRGLSSNRVLVYTQGIRLENQQFGDEHGLGISEAGIESIEVIKGPASLLYGSDALGGVLYLNPEKFAPQNKSTGDLRLNYFTNTQGFNTITGFKSSSNDFKFIFRGSLSEHADYKSKHFRVSNSRFREQDFKLGIGYQKNKFKSEFRYNLNASQLGIPENIGVQNTDTNPLLPSQNINNHIFSTKTSIFLNKSSFNLNLGFIYNDRKEFEEVDLNGSRLTPALQMKLKTFNYDLKYNLPDIGIVETIFGIQGMIQTNTNYTDEQLIPDAKTYDLGVLATSHIHFEEIDVQIGARFDHRQLDVKNDLNRNFNSFNAAIGARKDILKNIIARLNLASGFRAPNLAELTSDGVHEGTNRYEIGNPNLTNEQNIQVDLALEYKSDHLEVFANGFYNVIDNYIFISPSGDLIENTPVYEYIQDNAELYGGEFGLHFHPHPLDWLHLEVSFETVSGRRNDGALPLIPASKLNNIIRLDLNNEWIEKGHAFIKLSSTFKQTNVSDFETPTEAYSLLSAGIGGTIQLFGNQAIVNISGNNLTDKVYTNHLSRLKIDGIPNIGRNFSLGLNYSFL